MRRRRALRKRQREFVALDQWFDRLPGEHQEAIWGLHDEAAARAGSRVLPRSHGESREKQMAAAVDRFRRAQDPFALVRVGDSDLALLGAGFVPRSSPNRFEWYRLASGFGRTALSVRERFIAAVGGADLVGLHQNWEAVARSTATMLTMLGLPVPLPNAVEVHLPYRLLTDGTLFAQLAGKRVLLAGLLAPRLREVWATRQFRDAYSAWGDPGEVHVVTAVATRPREDGGAVRDYETILSEIRRHDFDVALLACGAAAKPLAWELRNDGRTALDVGFVFDALLGDPEREVRPFLRDAEWPKETWLPQ